MTTNQKIDAAAAKYGVVIGTDIASYELIHQMVAKGRAWLAAEAAKLKSTPQSQRRDLILAMARVAWEVAK